MSALVGLVSDTHDNVPLARQAAAFFRARRVDLLLHLGDVCGPETLHEFRGLPLQAVRGNNDGELPRLPDTFATEVAGARLFALHGHRRDLLQSALGAHDVVVHGHTHRRRAETVGPTLVVNPGALWRAHVRTVALLTLPAREVAFFEVGPEGVAALPR